MNSPFVHALMRYHICYILIASFLLVTGITTFSLNLLRSSESLSDEELEAIEMEKVAWNDFLFCHPYYTRPARSESEWKKIPKNDRPDLAAELDFMKTMDPTTGQVPYERLYQANKEVDEILSRRDPIANVTWDEKGPYNIGGRSRLLMFDPNAIPDYKKVWAGGVGGGLWYSNDITATTPVWNKVDDFWENIAVTTMAYSPANTSTLYVGTGEGWNIVGAQSGTGIWKSTNGGVSWSVLPNTVPGAYNSNSHFHYIQKIVANSTAVFAATKGYYGDTGGIMRSLDGGNTWTRVLDIANGANLYDHAGDIEIAANGDLYASFGMGSYGKVYKSTNNGANWTDLSAIINMGNARRVELACAPSNSSVVYAVAEGGSGNNDIEWIKRTTNGGTTWTSLTIPKLVDDGTTHFTRAQAFHNLILQVGVTNSDLIIAGGIDLHRSTDGGVTWTGISHNTGGYGKPEVHADQHAMAFRPSFNNEMVFTHDGGITYSANAGNAAVTPTFAHKNNGYNVTQFYSVATKNEYNSQYVIGGSQDNATLRITRPQAPGEELSGGDGGFCHIDQDDPITQYTSYVYNNHFVSWDGGVSFGQIIANNSGHFINPSEYDSDRNILYAATDNDFLKRVSGIPFNVNNTNLALSFGGSKISALKMSPDNDVLIAGIANGQVYKILTPSVTPVATRIDNGFLPITNTGWVSSIDIGADDNHILVTYSNYGVTSVWETTNGGLEWYSKEGDLPDMPVHWAIYNPDNRNQVLLATEVGVWSTDDFQPGTNGVPDWGPSNTNLAHTRCSMLKYRPADKIVVVATYGRGFFSSDIFAPGTVADFSYDQSSSCTGSLTVQFYDTSIKPNGAWAWDVDNNGFWDYFTRNPVHTYTTPGTYSVKLAVNAANETTVIKEHIIVVSSAAPVTNTGCSISSNSNSNNGGLIGIYSFKLAHINNHTDYNNGNYHDYSCSTGTGLDRNTTYDITIRTGTLNSEGARVYIDYDNNGIFESTESVVQFPANTQGLRTLSFTTPSTVLAGIPLRLRVLSRIGGVPSSACDIGTWGQAEDYTVMFKCQLLVNQTTATGVGSMSDCIACADDGDIITISSTLAGQTIDNGPGMISIGKNIDIVAEGANTTVTGGGDFVFIIQSWKTVDMTGFNIKATNGMTMSSGLLNYGNLTFNNMTMLRNPGFPGIYLITNSTGGYMTFMGNCYLED